MKQKAPFLTGFSTDLIGKAKRGAQEAICRFRQSALRESFSGYARLFENVLEPEFLAGLDPTKRNRHFGHLPVFDGVHVMLAFALATDIGLSGGG